VWRKAQALTVSVYHTTGQFPGDERYGLASQMRRAAVSVGANIAEGAARMSRNEFGHFLSIAIGSAAEVESHVALATDLGFIDHKTCTQLHASTVEVRKMLISLRTKVLAR